VQGIVIVETLTLQTLTAHGTSFSYLPAYPLVDPGTARMAREDSCKPDPLPIPVQFPILRPGKRMLHDHHDRFASPHR
jgi:hypothetical protein